MQCTIQIPDSFYTIFDKKLASIIKLDAPWVLFIGASLPIFPCNLKLSTTRIRNTTTFRALNVEVAVIKLFQTPSRATCLSCISVSQLLPATRKAKFNAVHRLLGLQRVTRTFNSLPHLFLKKKKKIFFIFLNATKIGEMLK